MDVIVPLVRNPVGRPAANPAPVRYHAEVAIIDQGDAERVLARRWTLHRHARGKLYAQETGSRGIMLHRFILGLPKTPGRDDKVDHKDGDGLNCRRSNLRVVTNAQNIINSASRGGSSQYKGVIRDARRGVWTMQISSSYATEEEAALAYNAAAIVLWGEHAWLNDVQ